MNFSKKDILKVLENVTLAGEGQNMVASGVIQNVVTFANEVIVDIKISTPAMHIKKRAEADIIKTIKENISEEADVKVNIKVEAPEKPQNPNLITIKI